MMSASLSSGAAGFERTVRVAALAAILIVGILFTVKLTDPDFQNGSTALWGNTEARAASAAVSHSATRGGASCSKGNHKSAPALLFTFYLPLGSDPVPVEVAGLHSVGEVARAAVRELALPAKLGRAVTAADVRLFVISREEALLLAAGSANAMSPEAKKRELLGGALDAFNAGELCEGSCLLVELKGEDALNNGDSSSGLNSPAHNSFLPLPTPMPLPPPPLAPNTDAAVQRYRSERASYGTKVDFTFAQFVVNAARAAGECNNVVEAASSASRAAIGVGSGHQAIIIGGANEGRLIRLFADNCPGLNITGLEIQAPILARVQAAFENERAAFPRVQMLHLGMSDAEGEASFAGGDEGSEMSSIMDTHDAERTRFRDWPVAPYKVKVLPLPLIYSRHVAPAAVFYAVIDVEGHEPLVIRGMGLTDKSAQRRFPAFQFEVGGTWAVSDPRHPRGSWLLPEASLHLSECGYELFVIGERDLLRVEHGFFAPGFGADENEGYGPTMSAGNVLALRREFAHPALVGLVDSMTWRGT